jgi:hypothetical protein
VQDGSLRAPVDMDQIARSMLVLFKATIVAAAMTVIT